MANSRKNQVGALTLTLQGEKTRQRIPLFRRGDPVRALDKFFRGGRMRGINLARLELEVGDDASAMTVRVASAVIQAVKFALRAKGSFVISCTPFHDAHKGDSRRRRSLTAKRSLRAR
ncbi:MAG: hypothetical protein HY475_03050 [Candidatus Terrybacteria bacterium]|nr:hypothetical protein [Candidatus Terrybacteria bacterium]